MPRKFLTSTKLLALLELAKETGNIDQACEKFGVKRATYYRWRARFEREGPAGLQRKPQMPRSSPRRFSTEDRETVVGLALQRPWMGCHKLAHAYFEAYGRPISGVSIHGILKDHHLETVAKRTDQAARNLIRSPNLRSGELWDFIRRKNPLIDILGLENISRGEKFLAALLPHPPIRGFDHQPSLKRDLPWAFVIVDLSTGYSFGNLRREGDSLKFWSPTIDLVTQTADALRFTPRIVQIAMASTPLAGAVEESLAWAFPTASGPSH